ncbi:hypothetical protein BOX15_Mlig034301g4, partial [Macrostomum lignano]
QTMSSCQINYILQSVPNQSCDLNQELKEDNNNQQTKQLAPVLQLDRREQVRNVLSEPVNLSPVTNQEDKAHGLETDQVDEAEKLETDQVDEAENLETIQEHETENLETDQVNEGENLETDQFDEENLETDQVDGEGNMETDQEDEAEELQTENVDKADVVNLGNYQAYDAKGLEAVQTHGPDKPAIYQEDGNFAIQKFQFYNDPKLPTIEFGVQQVLKLHENQLELKTESGQKCRRRKKRLRSNSPPRQAAAGAAQPPAAKRLRRRRQRHRSSCTNPANDSSTPVIAAVSDNLQFESGELRYIVVSGLPMSVRDAALHRAFRGVFRRRLLADADELVVVPESDTKTVLMFAGGEQAAASGWPLSARLGDNGQRLSARTVERRLRSLQFESRFPEDARLDSLRVEASDSLDYLRRWTRMYFCPVPYQIAEDIQCQHLLATNLPAKLLQSPEDLLRRFTQLMPDARSFFLPIDDVDQPLGYLLVRFDQSASCLATLRQLRRHYSLELVCVSLLEVCRLPCGYRIPVHNLLNWCCLDRPLSGPVSASVLSSAAVILDDPVRRPFVCTCHPDAVRVAPQPHLLTELARQLSVSATSSRMTATAAGTEAGALMSALMRLC